MKSILFAFPGNESLGKLLVDKTGYETGSLSLRRFPDGESYVRLDSDVKGKHVFLLCTLHEPDDKFLPLYFAAKTAKDLGASSVSLIAPYLAYMRQDIRFKPGEAISSDYFAALISFFTDRLITVDPHLHRHSELGQIYTIPAALVHASQPVADWIRSKVDKPLLVGPDEESEQWVSEMAEKAGAPYLILQKERKGDREVKVSVPRTELYNGHTPVLVDDIISTGKTMLETLGHLQKAGMKKAICIGVHAVFAGNAYAQLKEAWTSEIITCNTIVHESNGIDLSGLIASVL